MLLGSQGPLERERARWLIDSPRTTAVPRSGWESSLSILQALTREEQFLAIASGTNVFAFGLQEVNP